MNEELSDTEQNMNRNGNGKLELK